MGSLGVAGRRTAGEVVDRSSVVVEVLRSMAAVVDSRRAAAPAQGRTT